MSRSLRVVSQYIEQVKSSLQRNRFARQQDLAEELGISRDTVSRFFNGRPVGYLNFLEICEKLGLNAQEIADYENEDLNDSSSLQSSSLCNLPNRDFSKFIGRKTELENLLKYIAPQYRQHITIVEGIGGVGKTALVLEAAHLCWQAKQQKSNASVPIFDAIIFTSAKSNYLRSFGILERGIQESTLRDIFQVISVTLNDPNIMQVSGKEQIQLVYQSLAQQKTLLIVDNLETIQRQDRQEILSFLSDLPTSVQAVITTREKVVMYTAIYLDSLPEPESLQLIQQQAKEKEIRLTSEQSERLYLRFGGVPLALVYAVGQKAIGYSLKRILAPSNPIPKDIASFCFEGSVKPLREEQQSAYKLLISIAIFQKAPTFSALVEVAGLKAKLMDVEDGLAKLQQLSLVREQEDRYKMLSITRQYALAELAKDPNFKQEAEERWVKWYLEFAQRYGGKDWEDWSIKYEILGSEWVNIIQVLKWCATQERYADIKNLWQSLDNYVDIRGYWQIRLEWWDWLTKKSKQHGDLSTYVTALSEKSWTFILMGGENLETADKLLKEAWELREQAEFGIQARLANNIALLCMSQENYMDGLQMLDEAEKLVNQANIIECDRIRYHIFINYHRAEINYLQQNIDRAKQLFQTVKKQGNGIGWKRFANYAQNDLANIAIQEENFSEAEQLLQTGLFLSESYKEKRRIAHYQASYWRLERSRGNFNEALEWAKKALKSFQDEMGIRDALEIRTWLNSLEVNELQVNH